MIATLQPAAKPCRVPCENLDEEGPVAVVTINTQQLLGFWLCWALMSMRSLYKAPSAAEVVWINMIQNLSSQLQIKYSNLAQD